MTILYSSDLTPLQILMPLALLPGIPLALLYAFYLWWQKNRDEKGKSPFESQPRPAGWSLQRRCEDLGLDYLADLCLLFMVGIIGMVTVMVSRSWLAFWAVCLPISGWLCWRIIRSFKNMANCRLGLKGEQLVGVRLEELRAHGCLVFHDLEVTGKGQKPWNIDHILVAPAGVFVIETKCRRKVIKKDKTAPKGHVVIFDGMSLQFPFGSDRHGLDQATRNATYLRDLLKAQNPTPIPVNPVLVLPGWWVERKGKGDVAVVNEKELAKLLIFSPVILPPDLQRAVGNQIGSLCRT